MIFFHDFKNESFQIEREFSIVLQIVIDEMNNKKASQKKQRKKQQKRSNSSAPSKPKMPTPPSNPTPSTTSAAGESMERAADTQTHKNQDAVTNEQTTSQPVQPSPTLPPAPVNTETGIEPAKVGTLTPLKPEHSASLAQPLKPVSRWAFWKKGRQREEQLIRISEGYVEMVDMVRSISNQAEAQYQNNLILRDSLMHLPNAIQSLEGLGKSHEQVTLALEKINDQMETNLAKDERMADTMVGFNDTLKGMNGTTKATIQTFDRVQERMRDSDLRMENLFSNVRQSEERVSETMTRLQRNTSIFQALFLLCLLGIIGGLVYLFLNKEDFTNKTVQPASIVQPAVDNNDVLPTDPSEENSTKVDSTKAAPTDDIVPSDILPTDPEEIQQPLNQGPTEVPATEQPQVEEQP